MSDMHTQANANAHGETTMRDLLAVVFRRKWLILGIFGVTSLLVGVKEFTGTVSWSADATLLLNRQGARASVLERSGRVLPWTEVIESELEVVRSAPVLQRACENLSKPTTEYPEGIWLNPRKLSRMVTAGIVGESNVLFVTGSSDNPDVTVALTNAVAEAYVDYHAELYRLPDASSMIQSRADSAMAALKLAEQQRSRLRSDIGVNEVFEEERALVSQRENLRRELSDVERSLGRVQLELEDVASFLSGETDIVPFYENVGQVHGNALSNAYTSVMKTRRELDGLRKMYTDRHPEVQAKQSELTLLENDLRQRTQMLQGTREHELRALQSDRNELRTQIGVISARLKRLPAVVQQIDVLDAEIKALSNQYATLSKEAVTSEINSRSFSDYSVKVLSPAIAADKVGRGDLVKVALAPLLALMFGVGLAFYLENLDHSIANREDVERHVRIPVLASFPEASVRDQDPEGSGPRSTTSIPFRRRGSGRM